MVASRKRYPVALLLALLWLLPDAPAHGQLQRQPALDVRATPQGVQLVWQGDVSTATGRSTLAGWPQLPLAGRQLPAQLVTLRVPDGAALTPRIERLTSQPWRTTLASAAPSVARAALQPSAFDAGQSLDQLPTAPVTVLRQGRLRGQRIVVLAVSPIFEQAGLLHAASSFEVSLPGATLAGHDANLLSGSSAPFLAAAAGPRNPPAARAGYKLHVSQPGMQRVTGAALAAAGLDMNSLDPAMLQLWHAGAPVTLELRDADGNGRLDSAEELRFYAGQIGDRWNAGATYWLTIEPGPGLRMASRSVPPGAAPARSSALEEGRWLNNLLYDSNRPGPDGDHWFAADLRTGPGMSTATFTATLSSSLPPLNGNLTLTLSGTAITGGQHRLNAQLGEATASQTWSGAGDWSRSLSLATASSDLLLQLVPGTAPDGIELDSITWLRPVALSFAGQGASFLGLDGIWRYQLSSAPAGSTLYDISDPARPVLLGQTSGPLFEFEDGLTARRYLLAGPGTLQTPQVAAHQPHNLATALNAQQVYIAPAAFHSALAPLLDLRRAQGWSVALVDVQQIYDAWSFGQVAPSAIREFLRYAAATWNPAPLAVTLVGDGSSDPLDYTGRQNPNHIPPYLAMVDLWIGETACETCYAQLDGDDPLDGPEADILPDLALGRLPVASVAELETLVDKIVGYETAGGGIDWRSRMLIVADNYRNADGSIDPAGDFAYLADLAAGMQPAGMEVRRIYYDPSPMHVTQPWREPDAALARVRTIAQLNQGAGIVEYVGHSSYWQWAEPMLLQHYDADSLSNGVRLPIVLEMTCLTAAFQKPSYTSTIDERLLLRKGGGAVAVWGSTGLGVAHGHDALQRGFYKTLWQTAGQPKHLGTLTLGGYLEVFSSSPCCLDPIRTFALLGDPLTPALVQPASRLYLPLSQR